MKFILILYSKDYVLTPYNLHGIYIDSLQQRLCVNPLQFTWNYINSLQQRLRVNPLQFTWNLY